MKAYHYTNEEAYKSMQTKGIDGFISNYDDFTGLVPSGRFIRYGNSKSLINEAHDSVIEGLLESEPVSWMNNQEFPNLWWYLMHDICKSEKIILLNFDILPKDEAYIVDRAHVERELYRESKTGKEPTRETFFKAYSKFFDSRIPALEYNQEKHNYSVPQFAIWSPIELERLNVEWVKPHDEVWNKVLENKI